MMEGARSHDQGGGQARELAWRSGLAVIVAGAALVGVVAFAQQPPTADPATSQLETERTQDGTDGAPSGDGEADPVGDVPAGDDDEHSGEERSPADSGQSAAESTTGDDEDPAAPADSSSESDEDTSSADAPGRSDPDDEGVTHGEPLGLPCELSRGDEPYASMTGDDLVDDVADRSAALADVLARARSAADDPDRGEVAAGLADEYLDKVGEFAGDNPPTVPWDHRQWMDQRLAEWEEGCHALDELPTGEGDALSRLLDGDPLLDEWLRAGGQTTPTAAE